MSPFRCEIGPPNPFQPVEARLFRDLLAEHRCSLEHNGVVQKRGNHYRVRFREFNPEVGYRVHRSIWIGEDPYLAGAVADLIRRWKAERLERMARAEQRKAEEENNKRLKDLDHAQDRLLAGLVAGGGRNRVRMAMYEFDQAAAKGTLAAMECIEELGNRPLPKPGRRSSIWIW